MEYIFSNFNLTFASVGYLLAYFAEGSFESSGTGKVL